MEVQLSSILEVRLQPVPEISPTMNTVMSSVEHVFPLLSPIAPSSATR
jgi:hypothetical protein